MAERGEALQKSEAAGQEGQVMKPRVGVEMEEVRVVWIWSWTLCRGWRWWTHRWEWRQRRLCAWSQTLRPFHPELRYCSTARQPWLLPRPRPDLRGTAPEDHGIMVETLRKRLIDYWAPPARETEACSLLQRQHCRHCHQSDWSDWSWERGWAGGQGKEACGWLWVAWKSLTGPGKKWQKKKKERNVFNPSLLSNMKQKRCRKTPKGADGCTATTHTWLSLLPGGQTRIYSMAAFVEQTEIQKTDFEQNTVITSCIQGGWSHERKAKIFGLISSDSHQNTHLLWRKIFSRIIMLQRFALHH